MTVVGSENQTPPAPDRPRGSDYSELSRAVRAEQLLQRATHRYLPRFAVTLAGVVTCGWLMVEVGSSWFVLLVAAAFGIAFTQVAFLGHDGAHQQISPSRSVNTVIGLLAGNLLTGLSIGWWIDKHTRHHANPNKEHHDPDIGEGVLAFTTEQAFNRTGSISRALTGYQAFLFFPLLTLEGLNLHVASVRHLCRERSARLRRTETLLLTAHAVGYLGGTLVVLSPGHALAFIAVHQAAFGLYMGCSFAPNHKGMPIIAAHEKLDYLRRQVLTSRNVRGGWLIDQVLGGLNYQIEHHLFPSMPRPNLRRAQHLVRDFCADHAISYAETSLIASYAIALRHLHALGRPARERDGANPQTVVVA